MAIEFLSGSVSAPDFPLAGSGGSGSGGLAPLPHPTPPWPDKSYGPWGGIPDREPFKFPEAKPEVFEEAVRKLVPPATRAGIPERSFRERVIRACLVRPDSSDDEIIAAISYWVTGH